ncbi:MAG: hypothetical protein ACM3MK_04195 [Chitinophagales bacterium]
MLHNRLTPRQHTINLLQEFLRESTNLEPELENFVRILIFTLQAPVNQNEDSSEYSETEFSPLSPDKLPN